MKGQIQQVFIYIMMIIAVGFIFLIGYKAIGGIMDKSCDASKTDFKSQLGSYLSTYKDYGSIDNKRMTTPCSYSMVCFWMQISPPFTFMDGS